MIPMQSPAPMDLRIRLAIPICRFNIAINPVPSARKAGWIDCKFLLHDPFR